MNSGSKNPAAEKRQQVRHRLPLGNTTQVYKNKPEMKLTCFSEEITDYLASGLSFAAP